MFSEYDIVISNKDLMSIPKGSKGTIVLCYEDSTDYEVEFVDGDGDTIDVITVSEKDLSAAPNLLL
jgi:hypothetical protein